MEKKKRVIKIDCTPTWIGIYPALENMIMNGKQSQKEYVCKELKKLCETVDNLNKENKG